MDSIPDDDLEFLEAALALHSSGKDPIKDMFDCLREEESGVDVNGTWYDWDEIKHLF